MSRRATLVALNAVSPRGPAIAVIGTVLMLAACDNPTRDLLRDACEDAAACLSTGGTAGAVGGEGGKGAFPGDGGAGGAGAAGETGSGAGGSSTVDPDCAKVVCQKGQLCAHGKCTCSVVPCAECGPEETLVYDTVDGCPTCQCQPKLCKLNQDCDQNYVCTGGRCLACEAVPSKCVAKCDWGFTPHAFIRNGCPVCECTPPNDCLLDGDCGVGRVCYPGLQCDDGCTSAKCCFGN